MAMYFERYDKCLAFLAMCPQAPRLTDTDNHQPRHPWTGASLGPVGAGPCGPLIVKVGILLWPLTGTDC